MKKNKEKSLQKKLLLEEDFLRKIAHDLRSKLTSTLAYTQLLQKRVQQQPESVRLLQNIEKQLHSFTEHITDLTDLMRLSVLENQLTLEKVFVKELIDTTLQNSTAKHMTIKKNTIPKISFSVNKTYFQKMLINLILEEKDLVSEIVISAQKTNAMVTIFLDKIFYTAERTPPTSLEKLKGYITKRIAELHEGKLKITSSKKKKRYELSFPAQ